MVSVVAVVATTGCGSSRGTPAQFGQRAAAICARALQQLRGLASAAPAAGSADAAQRFARLALPIIGEELDSLRRLTTPPQPDRARATAAYLEALARVKRDLAVIAAPAGGAGSTAVTPAGALADLRASRAGALASAAGLGGCSNAAATGS